MSAPNEGDGAARETAGPILLVGAGFKNRGAEAMALTAVDEMGKRYPGQRIVVASYADKERLPWGHHDLEGRSFELIQNRKRLSHLLRVPLHALARLTPLGDFFIRGDPYLVELDQAAVVADLSGFALTDRRPLWRRLVYGFEIFSAWCLRRPFVALTQAFGPFRRFSSRLVARTMLPRAVLVIARGDRTRDLLREIGIDRRTRVEQCADIAYLLPPAPPARGRALLDKAGATSGPLVGIIPNVNLFDLRKPRTAESPYIHLIRRLCELVSRDLGAAPVLICHEEQPERLDDRWIAEEASRRCSEPVSIVSGSLSAADLKAVIGALDLAVASRFHSVVAAVSMRTPVVALGWAHKYAELMQEADLDDLILDAREADDLAVLDLVSRAWRERDAIRARLRNVPPDLEASARSAFDFLAEVCPPSVHRP